MKVFQTITTFGSVIAALCVVAMPVHSDTSVPAAKARVCTSTREITTLAVEADGTLWAGTAGGVLRRGTDGRWRKFTRQDGLPAHETRRILIQNGTVTAVFPGAVAVWRAGRWHIAKTANREQASLPSQSKQGSGEERTCEALWRGKLCVGTLDGLRLREGPAWRPVPLPASRGTHISALLPRGSALWAAMFGEGLWSFDGKAWQPVNIGLPQEAREITALAAHGSAIWLGTRRAGVWEYDGRNWKQHLQPAEPYNHNAQCFAWYQKRLFVSTLEDGLAVREGTEWRQETTPVLSSVAPRQMVAFGNALYVRHGSGKVDRLDGRTWTRDVCAGLPRKQALMIAADRTRLYVAQWGGWSEFDGKTWTHYLKLPELQGRPITVLYPDGDTLWIGTQNRGAAEFQHQTARLRWHDERQGLPDDWVTAIARVGRQMYVGTYVGGLAKREEGKSEEAKQGKMAGVKWTMGQLRGENVTALEPDGAGGLWVATRTGLWHQASHGRLTRCYAPSQTLGTEIQALCSTPDGLWVGTRTGLCFLPYSPQNSQVP